MSKHETTWPVWYVNRHALGTAPDQKMAHRIANLRQLCFALSSFLGVEFIDPGIGEKRDDPGGGGGGAYTPRNEHIDLGDFRASSNGLPETDGDWEKVCDDLERLARRLMNRVVENDLLQELPFGDDND